MGRLACWMFTVAFVCLAKSAFAVDGVVEINQASALERKNEAGTRT